MNYRPFQLMAFNSYESRVKYLAVVAFNWTGFISHACCDTLVMLIIDGCVWALNYFGSANLPLLLSVQNGFFTLLLKHRPWGSNNHLGRFDLQLSGHPHGGQIYPFNYLVSVQYPLPVGMVALPKESFLYTRRGSGTWGPQIRLLSPPEVTTIELARKK